MAKATVVAKTKIDRDDKRFIYYVKGGAVWQAPRKNSKGRRGVKKRLKTFVAGRKKNAKPVIDYTKNIYFVNGDGNVASARRSKGRRRKSRGRR